MDEKSQPLISLIIPIYNSSNTIEKCVDSVISGLNSENKEILEILLVDDGSTDNTKEICNKIVKDNTQVKYIYKDNGGVSSARNIGIDHASGIYIGFIDSDDEWDSKWANSVISMIMEKDYDLYIFSFVYYFSENKYKTIKISEYKGSVVDFLNIIPQLEGEGVFYASVCNKVYKSEIIKSHNIRLDESMTFGEDYSFNMDYLRYINSVKTINLPIYKYDYSVPESGVKRFREELADMLCSMYERISKLLFEYNISDSHVKNHYYNFISDAWLYITELAIKSDKTIKSTNMVLNEWYAKAPNNLLKLAADKTNNIYSSPIRNYREHQDMKKIILKIRCRNYVNRIKSKIYSILPH